ncbi:hypothetical protein B0F90DRAFT_1757760 [Multifurca ochricompacta]|uniref:Uncharacterized protein n=1 Tax=Multifurca ochricompacta TaxID=376703 RepID=A0AAD4QKE5_9AGAM|nr:hypothetical protein B0F90DRAFT_1757760 [Multifurca ochricompacta]
MAWLHCTRTGDQARSTFLYPSLILFLVLIFFRKHTYSSISYPFPTGVFNTLTVTT